MNALTVNNLYFAYPTTAVLQDINLTIADGERVALIGPNGAGKTTLFHVVTGIVKPNKGTVLLYDRPVTPGRFHPEVGLVFQYPDDQLFSPSVYDDVAFGPSNMGLSKMEVAERVERALATTGIADLAERPPHQLSGGQKRMVAIAGIIAMQPKLIIYDEPSANLDIRSRRRLIRFMQESAETMLISTHDLELVLEVCSRVVLLDGGEIIATGDPITLLADDDLMEAHGLERPHSLRPHVHTPGPIELHTHS